MPPDSQDMWPAPSGDGGRFSDAPQRVARHQPALRQAIEESICITCG